MSISCNIRSHMYHMWQRGKKLRNYVNRRLRTNVSGSITKWSVLPPCQFNSVQHCLIYNSHCSKYNVTSSSENRLVRLLPTFVSPSTAHSENRLECIRQSIRVRFNYRLRALAHTPILCVTWPDC